MEQVPEALRSAMRVSPSLGLRRWCRCDARSNLSVTSVAISNARKVSDGIRAEIEARIVTIFDVRDVEAILSVVARMKNAFGANFQIPTDGGVAHVLQ